MNAPFPFGFETSTAFYLALYVLTLVLHVFFMTYVLAGSLWLAWATLFPGNESTPRAEQPLALMLRDWLPFVLSAAITAGVAPLLFVQVLYRPHFYTANLLLSWRWMLVIPALIAAFYLLYLLKSRAVSNWRPTWSRMLGTATALCVLSVAFAWTANHLLSTREADWPALYGSRGAVPALSDLLPRLFIWVGGAFPTMSILAGWQLASARSTSNAGETQPVHEARRLAAVSIGGLVVAALAAAFYATSLDPAVRQNLIGPAGATWLIVALSGAAAQIAAWALQFRRACFCARTLWLATAGCVATLLGTASLREVIRLSAVDLAKVKANVDAATTVGGFAVFVAFAALNAILIAWCILLVRDRHRSEPTI